LKIIETSSYKQELKSIAFYIKNDKLNASLKFVRDLKKIINKLDNFPYKYRKSIYFKNEHIREMIFNGYTIIYKVNINEDIIEVLTIFNKNKKKEEDV